MTGPDCVETAGVNSRAASLWPNRLIPKQKVKKDSFPKTMRSGLCTVPNPAFQTFSLGTTFWLPQFHPSRLAGREERWQPSSRSTNPIHLEVSMEYRQLGGSGLKVPVLS